MWFWRIQLWNNCFLTYLLLITLVCNNILSWWYPRIAILRLFERMFAVCAFGINKWFEFEFESESLETSTGGLQKIFNLITRFEFKVVKSHSGFEFCSRVQDPQNSELVSYIRKLLNTGIGKENANVVRNNDNDEGSDDLGAKNGNVRSGIPTIGSSGIPRYSLTHSRRTQSIGKSTIYITLSSSVSLLNWYLNFDIHRRVHWGIIWDCQLFP